MRIQASTENLRFVRNYHWLGILVVCLLSFPLHFLYDWSGGLDIIGIFTPINESIWEHLKLVYWPLILWWGIGFIVFKDKKNLNLSKWIPAGTLSILFGMLFIVSWYYVWRYALRIENEWTNIGSLFIAVPIGQLIAIHVYRVIKSRTFYTILSILLLLLLAVSFAWFTFQTPTFPLFISPS